GVELPAGADGLYRQRALGQFLVSQDQWLPLPLCRQPVLRQDSDQMGGRRWPPPPFPRRTARFCHAAGSFLPIPAIPPRFPDSSVQRLLLTLCLGFEGGVSAMIRRYRVWACAAGLVLLGAVAPARAVGIIGQQGTPVAAPACASGGQGCLGGKCPCFPALTD